MAAVTVRMAGVARGNQELPQSRFEAPPEYYAGSLCQARGEKEDAMLKGTMVGIKAEAPSSSSAAARGAAVGRSTFSGGAPSRSTSV